MNDILTSELIYWRDQEFITFASGVEETVIADGRAAIRTQDGHFVAVSPKSEPLIALLREGCSGSELVSHIHLPVDVHQREREHRVASFLDGLRAANALNIKCEAASSRWNRLWNSELLLRIPLYKSEGIPLFSVLGRFARERLSPRGWLIIAGLGIVFGISAIPEITFSFAQFDPSLLVLLPLVVLAQVLLHEFMHGAALGYVRVPVRSVGLGLLLLAIPTAYVDRTGTYNVSNRIARAMISLAGPISDLVLLGFIGIALRLVPAADAGFLHLVAIMLLITIVINLNPLFLSDGHHALEALFGVVNTRNRAFTFVWCLMAHQPLPYALDSTSRSTRIGFAAYVVGSLAYVVVVVASLGRSAIELGSVVWQAANS
ncbi:hypothetical protein ACEXOS_008735 [Herbiconiux sp. P16]|uniref:hypothetical protein n=1 Tax=Herbiconiux wuyangfengii TaxID=3342794 RepID=UPI0035BB4F95